MKFVSAFFLFPFMTEQNERKRERKQEKDGKEEDQQEISINKL